MRIIGLTGGIACGKSTVAKILSGFGVRICDADVLAKAAVRSGSDGLQAVVKAFGASFLAPDGELDRAKLGSLVFSNPKAKSKLERIVHPLVRRSTEEQLAAWRKAGAEAAVVMAPLLLEAGMENLVDEVWVVVAPLEAQLDRLSGRNGLPKEAALARIASQWPQEEKRRRADLVIANDGSPEDLVRKVTDIWSAWRNVP